MGWTHNWRRPTELPAELFQRASDDVRRLIETLGVELAGFDGTGYPIIDADRIVFNGGSGGACEPFEIARIEFDRRGRDEVFSFCKTEQLPYDLAVQGTLIVLKHHLAEQIDVGSDGEDKDWHAAREAVTRTLGYGSDFILACE